VSHDALARRLQRLDARLADVQAGVECRDPNLVPIAVADSLDALYDLWELWRSERSLQGTKAQDAAVAGDPAGELTAALVLARGGKSHGRKNFGLLLGYGLGAYGEGPYGADGWYWQPYVDQNPRYATRNAWYANRLEYRQVLPTLEAASRWLCSRPELARPPRV
jgi:hypothetical protein